MDAEILFLSLLLILQIQFNSCLPKYSMNINQTIKEGDYLVSNGNNFALGFFSPGNSSYRYLGIWYRKVPQKTVVWVANRNHPINDSSGILSFDQYGNLILYSGSYRQVPVWSTNVSTEVTDTCVAQLLDSGNFVLVQDRRRKISWQSFDYPTNFMLPGMKLGLDRRTGTDWFLTAWRSADDPGIGNYSVKVNPNGSPQLVLYKGREIFYRTAPWPWKRDTNLYRKNFVNRQDQVYCVYNIPDDSITLTLTLDHSGFFKMVIWDESDGQWKEFWKVPQNRCDFYGRCGAYSTCQAHNANRFECACLPGYEPKNLSGWLVRDGSGGCVKKRVQTSLVCGHGDGFVKVESVLLPDTSAAVWMDVSNSDSDCEQECKRNCSCSAYASIDVPGQVSGCLTWYGELIDTAYDRAERHDLFIRVDALELAKNASKPNGSLEKERLAILLPTVASVWFIISLFAYFGLRRIRKTGTSVSNVLRGSCNNTDFEFFKLRTLCAATNNFSPANKLGQGGFGSVYKGHLPNGQEVAVKRLSKNSGEGIEEFKNEATIIAKLQHRNLVKLVGCCIQGEERMLIYEYLLNKSLDLFLFDETRKSLLDWSKRFEIIVGIARGILYLHQDSRLRIIHRDLKCSNILLDSEMNPKISDFGVAKIFNNEQIQGNTNRVVGTYGYMSPEYAVLGIYSVKSDVFSFGVMLLEIVSGQKNSGFSPQESSVNLIGHVWELWREDRALEIVDSSLKGLYHPQEAMKCIQIGLLCVQEDAMDRPSMLAVVFMLNSSTATALASPKQPAFILGESSNNPCTPSVVEEEEDRWSMNETIITRSPEL